MFLLATLLLFDKLVVETVDDGGDKFHFRFQIDKFAIIVSSIFILQLIYNTNKKTLIILGLQMLTATFET